MNKYHEEVLNSAKEWLSSIDEEVFLKEFFELQEEAAGPTVDEFLLNFNLETTSLFGIDQCRNSIINSPINNLYSNSVSFLTIKNTLTAKVMDSFRNIEIDIYEIDNITETFKLRGKAVSIKSDDFQSQVCELPFCEAA